MLYALLVPYVGKNLTVNSDFTAVICGNHKSAHCHKGKQPHSLKGNCLTTCVGACDN